jgi:PKHD-type hydroxylase
LIVTFDNIISSGEVKEFRKLLSNSRFIDGKKTAGYRAKRVKKNEQAAWDQETAKDIQDRLLEAIKEHKKLVRTCHPKKISRPLISKSSAGMGYGFHVDDAQIGAVGNKNRSDVSMTLFLSDPDEYEGGELEIITPYGAAAFKLPAGHAITYPSRFLHQVRTVSTGERLVAVCWMESHIRNEQDREILMELDQVNQKLHKLAPDAAETDLAFKVYANLARKWIE